MSQIDTIEAPPTELPAHESDTLWTADSERQPAELQTSDPVPAAEPPEFEATPDPAAASPAATPDRDETGKFKKPGKPRNDPIARMQQATQKEAAAKEEARLAREEAAALKARLEALERAPRTPEPSREVPRATLQPQGGRFPAFDVWSQGNPDASYEDYIDARADWRYEQRAEVQRRQQVVQNYNTQLEAAKASDPVLVQALQTNARVSGVMEAAILESKQSIDIVRYLGTHPEVCAQLAEESIGLSADAVPVMRRHLEAIATTSAAARPDTASAVRPSTANPPINRVGGTASATPVDPDDLPFGPDYIRLENAKEKKRQESSRW